MTNYPIELPGAPLSGLSADQSRALFAAAFLAQVQKAPRLGANTPMNHLNAVGLWYWGTTPFGDWSGTTQQINEDGDMGSGGPALCPYSTAGAHTIVGAGMVRDRTGSSGSSLTSLGLEKPLAQNLSTYADYAGASWVIAARKMTERVVGQSPAGLVAADVSNDPPITGCDWEAATGKLTLTGGKSLAGVFTFTGDDWCYVRGVAPVSGVKGRPGWYRVESTNGTDEITLTPDAIGVVHESDVAGGVDILLIQSAQARAISSATYVDTVSISGTAGRTDSFVSNLDTFTVGGRPYTFVTGAPVGDQIAIPAPTDDSGGWTAAQRNTILRAIADALRLNSSVQVLEENDAITSTFSFRAATRTQIQVSMSLATGLGLSLGGYESAPGVFEASRGKFIAITGGTAVVSDDDTLQITNKASVGDLALTEQTFIRVDAGDGAAALWAFEDEVSFLALDSGEVVKATQYLRYSWVLRDVVTDAVTGANDTPVVSAGVPKAITLEANLVVGDTFGIVGGTAGNADRIQRTWTMVAGAPGLVTELQLGATLADTCTAIAARINAQFGAYIVAVAGATTVTFTKGGGAFADTVYTLSKVARNLNLGNGTALNTLRYDSNLSGSGWTDPRFKRGDLYLVWVEQPLPVGFPTQIQSTNPEAVPTLSARNSKACLWPLGTPGRAERAAYPGTYPNVFAAPEDSQMHSAWWGTFRLPREMFLHGDKVQLSMVADVQAFGTPFLLEVLVIPDFDPETDWFRASDVTNGQRLLEANGKAMWFQSPTVIDVDSNVGCQITLGGQAGSVQTIGVGETGDNYSQQWTCTFDLYGNDTVAKYSGTGGGANLQARGFPHTIGPAAHITTPDVEAFATEDYAFTVFVTAIHPSQKNQPGYHGYHAGEPFSCKTGNGGVRFTYRGQGSNVEADSRGQNQTCPLLPYGGSFRVAAFNCVHTPGGSY